MFPNHTAQPPGNGQDRPQQPDQHAFQFIMTPTGPLMVPYPLPGQMDMPKASGPAPAPPPQLQLWWMSANPIPVQKDQAASPQQQQPEQPHEPKSLSLAPLPKPTQDPNNPATLPSDYYTYRDKGWSKEEELEKLRKKKTTGK